MSSHARLSPSASARWIACPGSVALSERAPHISSSTAYAERGTALHAMAADYLRGVEVDVPAEIKTYCDYAMTRIQQRRAAVWIEQPMSLDAQIFGTPDLVIACGQTLEVVDLKTGFQEVKADGNTQLICYAEAALRTYPAIAKRIKTIRLTIVQQSSIATATLSRPALRSHVAAILAAADRASRDGAPRFVGPHCQYCHGAVICAERKAETLQHARSAFTEPEAVDQALLCAAIEDGKRVIEHIESLIAYAVQHPPMGYAVVEGRGRRVWKAGVDIPLLPKPMTLAEATERGLDLSALTEYRAGAPKLVKTGDAISHHFTDDI